MKPKTKEVLQLRLDGEVVEVIRSSRRKKTLQARRLNGKMQLLVPMVASYDELQNLGGKLIKKLHAREERHSDMSNADLKARADYLARTWLGGEVEANSVVWSESQERIWGNCRPAEKRIRISTAVVGMPQWVLDGLLIHELAHLKFGPHNNDFHQFTYNYPQMKEANAFLRGVTWAQHRRKDGTASPDDLDFPGPPKGPDGDFELDVPEYW